ncbi:MAG TPA: hypothetical protein VLB84_00070 [Bacteroidia bacterium]|nr:hypothetical protein [Bacteroidia bacterium]
MIVTVYAMVYHVSCKDIPSPALSDSYSLNEKIEFLREAKKDVPVLAIGSSIALNNLHSETVSKRIQGAAFLNASSWGMNMGDNYAMLKALYDVFHPQTLIIASSISEFELPAKKADYDLVQKYITTNDFIASLYHIRCFNLRYYMDNVKYKKLVTSTKNQYEYLVFDKYGGVNIEGEGFIIDQRRWNASFDKEKMDSVNYNYVDSISSFCKSKNVRLLFFQSPFREGIYSSLNTEKSKELKEHVGKIASMLKKNNQVLIDSDQVLWNDSLFIDGEHLNSKGAKAFTGYCFDQLNKAAID